jgi:hypothetical protein
MKTELFELEFDSRQGQRIVLLSAASRQALAPPDLLSSEYRGLFPGGKRAEAEVTIDEACTLTLHFSVQRLLTKLSSSVLTQKYVYVYSSGIASKFVWTETREYGKFFEGLDCIYICQSFVEV